MSQKYDERKLYVSALCRVSSAGAGIYLYIPKHFADAYNLTMAEYVEVLFTKVFSKRHRPDDDGVVDLRSRKKRKALDEAEPEERL